jgi:hypothetical protein
LILISLTSMMNFVDLPPLLDALRSDSDGTFDRSFFSTRA